ncbi:MAG: hypothetical protein M1828_000234 [Chrysothrix sp. TS-e1954]|nr:MAG: hypothetical protein M1828_000234 [Chrysothrix sp. TS-e1954]
MKGKKKQKLQASDNLVDSSTRCFPTRQQLYIVTPNKIRIWTSSGILSRYKSSSQGIVAASEASSSPDLLALAEDSVVSLRDRRGLQRKYRLRKEQGKARLVQFDTSSTKLFFTTEHESFIHQYSIDEDRIVEDVHHRGGKPSVLAISSSQDLKSPSKYLLSAASCSTWILLGVLAPLTKQIYFKSTASEACISAATFHPENEDLFALGYVDGSLSLHSARLVVQGGARGSDGKLALHNLHRVSGLAATYGTRSRSLAHEAGPIPAGQGRSANHKITADVNLSASRFKAQQDARIVDVAFLHSYSARAVTICDLWKCRIIDFDVAEGPKLLQTWDIYPQCTSLSIASWQLDNETTDDEVGVVTATRGEEGQSFDPKTIACRTAKHEPRRGPSSQCYDETKNEGSRSGIRCCIAIGSSDGRVALYDSIGCLKAETVDGLDQGCVLRLEWRISEENAGRNPKRILKRPWPKKNNSTERLKIDCQRSLSALSTSDLYTRGCPNPPTVLLESLQRRRDIGGSINSSRLVGSPQQKLSRLSTGRAFLAETTRNSHTISSARQRPLDSRSHRMSLIASPSTSLCSHPVLHSRHDISKGVKTLSKLRHVYAASRSSSSSTTEVADEQTRQTFDISPPTDRMDRVAHVAGQALDRQVARKSSSCPPRGKTHKTAEELMLTQQNQEWIPDADFDEHNNCLEVPRKQDLLVHSPTDWSCSSPSAVSDTSSKTAVGSSPELPTTPAFGPKESLTSRFAIADQSRLSQYNHNFTRFPMQDLASPTPMDEKTPFSLEPLLIATSKAVHHGRKNSRAKELPLLPSTPISPVRSESFTSPRKAPPVPERTPKRSFSISSPRPVSANANDSPMRYMAGSPRHPPTPHSCAYSSDLEKQVSTLQTEVEVLRKEVKRLSSDDTSIARVGRLFVRRSGGPVGRRVNMPRTNSRGTVPQVAKNVAKAVSGSNAGANTSTAEGTAAKLEAHGLM